MDPLTVVGAVAKAVESVFNYLSTPAGQKQAELWIADQERFRKDWDAIGAWIKGLVK